MKDDTIKRKDAIGAINGWLKRNHFPEIGDGILYLVPSADNEIIGKLKTAIENEEICKNCPTAERITGENLLGAMALGFSYGMEVSRPQGEWKHFKDDEWLCSNCGYVVQIESWWEHPLENGKDYCEHCGAKMFAKGINVPNKKGKDDERHNDARRSDKYE